MRLVSDIEFEINTESDKSILSSLSNNHDLQNGTHCVYVYSLSNSEIIYPLQLGKVIYIVEASRENEPTGNLFSNHISTTMTQGNNAPTNRAISMYYYSGYKLRLQIYRLDNVTTEIERKDQEKKLYTLHAKLFGALPIGQGTTGLSYTPDTLSDLQTNEIENAAVTP